MYWLVWYCSVRCVVSLQFITGCHAYKYARTIAEFKDNSLMSKILFIGDKSVLSTYTWITYRNRSNDDDQNLVRKKWGFCNQINVKYKIEK